MIKYRPHKRTLQDAMKETKEFNSIKEMKEYMVKDWNEICENVFGYDDIVINDEEVADNRIGWNKCHMICVKRICNDIYDVPQCIGFCNLN